MNLSSLEITDLWSGLHTKVIGRSLVWCPVTGSTNDLAKDLARSGAPEGTVVLAGEQQRGRGRRGREWLAPPGSSILLSVLFRPGTWLPGPHYLTMACSLGLVDALGRLYALESGIKWPNDVVIRRKKVAGLLTELVSEQGAILAAVVGIGVNVNFDVEAVPEIRDFATSIASELGHEVTSGPLLEALITGIDNNYLLLCSGGYLELFDCWQSKLIGAGERVTVDVRGRRLEGVLGRPDRDGSIALNLPGGQVERLTDAEISLHQLYNR